MPIAAVLGWPLTHTCSPQLHNAAYRACGLTGWRYEARPTRPGDLPAALEELAAGRLAGANITTPHKQAAAALLDHLEPPAGQLGAVNLVVPSADPEHPRRARLVGHNTDVAGGLLALTRQLRLHPGEAWDGEGPAVLMGTGGAALAMALAWQQLTRLRQPLPTAPLTVIGRDPARGEHVAAHAGPGAAVAPLEQATALLAEARVLIQATTLTARGEPIPGQSALRAGVRVLDCNYGPKVAVLLDAARASGAAVAIDGLGMLVGQAAAGFGLITGDHTHDPLPTMAAAAGLPWPPAA
jgi:shikimate dehydrogenase